VQYNVSASAPFRGGRNLCLGNIRRRRIKRSIFFVPRICIFRKSVVHRRRQPSQSRLRKRLSLCPGKCVVHYIVVGEWEIVDTCFFCQVVPAPPSHPVTAAECHTRHWNGTSRAMLALKRQAGQPRVIRNFCPVAILK
jgi:hypothetical protein